MYHSAPNGSPSQTYASSPAQVYHPTPTSPSQHLYTNVLNAPTALSYPTNTWHNGTTDYGIYQNSYPYQSEFFPIVPEIG